MQRSAPRPRRSPPASTLQTEFSREQAHLPAEQPPAGPHARVPSADADPRRSLDPLLASTQGPQRTLRLTAGSCRSATDHASRGFPRPVQGRSCPGRLRGPTGTLRSAGCPQRVDGQRRAGASRIRRRPSGGQGSRAQPGASPAARTDAYPTSVAAAWQHDRRARPSRCRHRQLRPSRSGAGRRARPGRTLHGRSPAARHRWRYPVTAWPVAAMVIAGLMAADLLLASTPVERRLPRLARTPAGAVRGPLAWTLGWLVRFYRAAWSARNAGMCRFEPSCSAYALAAVRRHGGVRGGLLACARLLRCQPLSAGGYDPVPGAAQESGGERGVPGDRPVGTIGRSRLVRDPRRVEPVRALGNRACRPAGVDTRRMRGRGPRSSVPVADRGREE